MGAWLFSWLPFAPINRVCFLYHYLLPLYFSVLLAVCIVQQLRGSRAIIAMIVILAAVAFVYWAPIAYGLSVGQEKLKILKIYSNWW